MDEECGVIVTKTRKTEILQQNLLKCSENQGLLYSGQDVQKKLFHPHVPGFCSENHPITPGVSPDFSMDLQRQNPKKLLLIGPKLHRF